MTQLYQIVRIWHCQKDAVPIDVSIFTGTTLEKAHARLRFYENDRLGEDAVDEFIDFSTLIAGSKQGYTGEIHDYNESGETDVKVYTVGYKVTVVTID